MYTPIDPLVALIVVAILCGAVGLMYFVPKVYNEWALKSAIQEAEEVDDEDLPNLETSTTTTSTPTTTG